MVALTFEIKKKLHVESIIKLSKSQFYSIKFRLRNIVKIKKKSLETTKNEIIIINTTVT